MGAVSKPCPCGSGLEYSGCCEPLHLGAAASNPEALMRSRSSAFALGLDAYLLASWHPDTRPATLELDDTVWRRLQIVDTSGDVVEFRASYRGGVLHERSRFAQVDGRWLYLSPVE